MRMKEFETTVSTPCLNTMEGENLNGASLPVTDIKYSPNHNDAVNSNGILSPPTTPSATTPVDNDYSSSATGSGRFKFFKDGKFILELWHHRNGERMYWIPVSKSSTCWPSTVNCASRQESSTSLSVSDDNLSIQSSPWQRDHIWKQNIPRKSINRELEFSLYVLRRFRKKHFSPISIRRKRRKPYDIIKIEEWNNIDSATVSASNKRKDVSNNSKYKLPEIVQMLWERKVPCENNVSLCRTDPGIVSPRKRILKEMEKVTLDELGNVNKKHRTKVIVNCTSPSITLSSTANSNKQVSSHSINAILAKDEEPSVLRNLLRSPSTENSYESSSRSTFENDSPSSDVRTTTANHSQCSTPVTSPLLPCPQPIPAYHIPPSYIYHSTSPYLSPPSISTSHPPYYSLLPSNYPSSPAIWGFRSLSSLPRSSVYPSSSIPSYSALNTTPWIPLAHSSFQSYPAITDNGTDVPLNLSKHPC